MRILFVVALLLPIGPGCHHCPSHGDAAATDAASVMDLTVSLDAACRACKHSDPNACGGRPTNCYQPTGSPSGCCR